MKVRFLLDENLPPHLKTALLRFNPSIDVIRVGDPEAPPTGSSDPEILRYLEITGRLLVTSNRASMPGHIKAHWDAGGHVWGILLVRPGATLSQLAQDLLLVWEATEAEEWLDRIEWIPF